MVLSTISPRRLRPTAITSLLLMSAITTSALAGSIAERKNQVRALTGDRLKALTSSFISEKSTVVRQLLTEQEEFNKLSVVCIYLSMPQEVQTFSIIKYLLEKQKTVYIPKIIGKKHTDMVMYRLQNYEEIESFPKNKWGIPEPPIADLLTINKDEYFNTIDGIIVPAVAFDKNCGRVGHGKGYYDYFIDSINNSNSRNGRKPPVTIGVGFDEQIYDEVPMDENDQILDIVVTPSSLYKKL